MTAAKALLVFVLGSLGGALCDQIHVQSGVLFYASPDVLAQAWWVAPQFGLATIVILLGTRLFQPQDLPAPPGREIAVASAWFIGAYVASAFAVDNTWLLAGLCAAAFVGRVAVADRRWAVVGFSAALAAGGSLYEGMLSSTGVFSYAVPLVWTIPAWLPGLYLHGAPLALLVARLPSLRDSAT